ncbi:MAG: hypothetical protein AAFP86_15285, partial [Planctomycetota bacterium]
MFRQSTQRLLTGAFLATSALAQVDAGEGFRVAGSLDIAQFCGRFPGVYSFLDGSTIVFDGQRI